MKKYFIFKIEKKTYCWKWSDKTLYIDFDFTFKLFFIQYFKRITYRPDNI